MSRAPWTITSASPEAAELVARIEAGRFQGRIDVHRPQFGLCGLTLGGRPIPAALLAAHVSHESGAAPVVDCYVRGDDLIATYAQEEPWRMRSQIYWRRLNSPADADVLGLELIVSVQTALLHSEPQLTVSSELPAVDVWRLAAEGSQDFQRLEIASQPKIECTREDGGSMFVVRGPDQERSLVQMIHPSDFHCTTVARLADANGPAVSLAHDLFPESLEKGVIRRGRVRAWLLERAGDLDAALEYYRQWLAEPPPLTT